MKYLYYLCLIFAFHSCEQIPLVDKIFTITATTTSNDSLVCFLEYDVNAIHYPDTNLPIVKPFKRIVRKDKPYYLDRQDENGKWEDYIASLPKDTLSIFFMDAKIFTDSTWQTIRDKYLVLKRYDLSAEQLKNLNFTINYP
jgi:hypothetical protein